MSTPDSTGGDAIVHVIGATIAGGAETFVGHLVEALAAAGKPVALLVLSNRSDTAGDTLRRRLDGAGIPWFCGPGYRVGAATVRWYRRKLREINPGIVHLHTPNTEQVHYLATWPGHPARLFRTLHSTMLKTNPLGRWAMARNRMQASIACGTEVAQLARTAVKGAVACIPNGVAFHWPVQNPEEKLRARLRLGLEAQAWHCLSVGRFSADRIEALPKAQDILLQAWRGARFGRDDVFLHLLGDGNRRASLENSVKDIASIRFQGVRADVHDWLLAADCFVMPSRYEGLPIAGIEAVGTGVPCIFSDIAPLRELACANARWVPPDEVFALREALQAAAAQCVEAGADAEDFRRRYGLGAAVAGYIGLYETCRHV